MNLLKDKLNSNEVARGGWVQLAHPGIVEIFGNAGFDWICLDLQHGVFNKETLVNLIPIIEKYYMTPVVRLPSKSLTHISHYLDMGFKGIIVPDIQTAEEAQAIVDALRLPPVGKRSFGYCRNNHYGQYFEDWCEHSTESTAIIMQIEHVDALNNLDAILRIDGVDATFIGPLDLRGSIDINMDPLLFKKMIDRYLDVCHEHSKPPGMHIVDVSEQSIINAVREGYKMLALGTDTIFLREMARKVMEYGT